jgi:peptidoglycan/LPS O-acetylase OafA/YrhL
MSAARPLSRIHMPALDGIRGIAILLVIPRNAGLLLDIPVQGHGALYVTRELMQFGWAGVQLFFVLSGFLISGALLDTRRAGDYYAAFYQRRALRILPLYFGVLALTFLLLAPLRALPREVLAAQSHQIWLWAFLSNWTDPLGLGVPGFTHFWSLAVEWQFYLLWPLIVRRLDAEGLLRLALLVALASLAIRIAMRAAGCPPEWVYEFSVCRMDALTLGAAAAAMLRIPAWESRLRGWSVRFPWLIALAIVAGAPLTRGYPDSGLVTQTAGMTLLAVCFAGLVVYGALGEVDRAASARRILSVASLRSIGKYSYAMYVFHYPLHKLVGAPLIARLAPRPGVLVALAYVACVGLVSYGLAWLSWRLLESPCLRWRRYAGPAGSA